MTQEEKDYEIEKLIELLFEITNEITFYKNLLEIEKKYNNKKRINYVKNELDKRKIDCKIIIDNIEEVKNDTKTKRNNRKNRKQRNKI